MHKINQSNYSAVVQYNKVHFAIMLYADKLFSFASIITYTALGKQS